jgi:hypothetical protein
MYTIVEEESGGKSEGRGIVAVGTRDGIQARALDASSRTAVPMSLRNVILPNHYLQPPIRS